jgi:hypothetical protein
MHRRNYLKMMLGAFGTITTRAVVGATIAPVVSTSHSIELHLDLAVDPNKEQRMLGIFHADFKPAASKQPGYIDMKLLKLTSTLRGPAPADANYQFVLTFATEELRQKWVGTETHKVLWPTMEACLSSKNYSRLLYEVY